MSSKSHYYSIDILRGLTAFIICLYHFINHSDANGYLFDDGSIVRNVSNHISDVVFIFFLISGFVIPLSMAKMNYKINKILPYLSRRLIRLEIPYIASMLLVLVITFAWSVKEGSVFHLDYWQILNHFTYTVAIFNYPWLNLIYWTLAIEIQFYIVIALLFSFITSTNKFIQYTTIILFGLSGLLFPDTRFIFQYAPIFTVGILFYLSQSDKKSKNTNLILMSVFLLLTIFSESFQTFIYLSIALLLIVYLKPNKILEKFGSFSYSFYLIHGSIGGSIIYFLSKGVENNLLKFVIVLIAIIASIVFSYLFYLVIERSSHRLSKKISLSFKNKTN